MYPGVYGVETPDRVAAINSGSGEVLTYGRLNEHSNQLAQFLHAKGLRRGDHIAIFMDNNLKFYEVGWAAMRSGLYITTINRYLTAEEAGYIVTDSGSKALITTDVLRDVAGELLDHMPNCPIRLMAEGTIHGYESYETTLDAMPTENLEEEPQGAMMLYSSGTTGRPKGIKRPLPDVSVRDVPLPPPGQNAYGFDRDSVYLSPAPLYHSAPFGFSMGILKGGGTVIVMPKFDARDSLRCIDQYRITHSQWVPTMFVRMLKLDPEDREGWDLSSHKVAIHAAAPCPVEVKRQMIEWWGPIIFEYYAGTESNGSTAIDSEDWLAHPGSVGKARGSVIHICDDEGSELPVGEPGLIYFEQERMSFEYHNDAEKTRSAQHPEHPNWSALGDVGYLDEEGYL
ncbi:MAG: AMP-binding protein, partial [Pseudomonadales bacterium]